MKKFVVVNDYLIFLNPHVKEPGSETIFLSEQVIKKQPQGTVAVVGTGSGLLPILLSPHFLKIIGLEINSIAVDLSTKNKMINDITNIDIRQSDLFSSLNEKVDIIIANPPQLPSFTINTRHWHSVANDGGIRGRELIDRIIEDAPEHLNRGGKLFLLQLEFVNFGETIEKFAHHGMTVRRLDSLKKSFSEYSRFRTGIIDREDYELTVFEGTLGS